MGEVADTAEGDAEAGSLVVEDRFAIVPEWLLDAQISDCAVRLYAVLLRYGQSSGARMPGRATLARRLRKQSTDTVDRALKELVTAGAVVVEHRFNGGQRLTNRYHLRSVRYSSTEPATAVVDSPAGSRTDAATRTESARGSRTKAARTGRSCAAGVAAPVRHNPQHLTQSITTSPPEVPTQNGWRVEEDRFLTSLGITDIDRYLADCQRLRTDIGASIGRWVRPSIVAALQAAVRIRGWSPDSAAKALLVVAADPATRSPMRVAEAGPWWDTTPSTPGGAGAAGVNTSDQQLLDTDDTRVSLAEAETELADADGLRVHLQATARAQLTAEGLPITRATVIRRAHQLLKVHQDPASSTC